MYSSRIYVSDTITFFLVEIGIMRANCIFFPISPRNSPGAVAHLLTETNALHLLTGPEPAFQNLASAAFDQMRTVGNEPPALSVMPSFDDIVKTTVESDFIFLPRYPFRLHETANIFHSFGTYFSEALCHYHPTDKLLWFIRFISIP